MGRVVLVGRGDGEGQGDAVGCVGNQVHLVAEAIDFCLPSLAFRAVLEAPAGVRVADHLAVRITVSLKEGGVHGQHRPQRRQRLVLLALPAASRWEPTPATRQWR